jgi:hypothetical protein
LEELADGWATGPGTDTAVVVTGSEAGPAPGALTAATVNVYCCPGVSPVIVALVADDPVSTAEGVPVTAPP